MFDLIRKIMPREEKFFDLFEAHAAKSLAAARILRLIMDGGPRTAALCSELMKLEEEADAISLEVLQALRRSFITPFDRSDIKNLATSLDDAIDQMNKTAKAVMLFDIDTFEPHMRAMADDCVKLAEILVEAMPLMRQVGANSARLHELTGRMVALEEDSDQQNEAGLKALLKGKAKQDAMAFIIGSEIYEHLEKVADRFEDVAHAMADIVIEHV
jgi:predicted phosphate transport protein (TIGR00153 family)